MYGPDPDHLVLDRSWLPRNKNPWQHKMCVCVCVGIFSDQGGLWNGGSTLISIPCIASPELEYPVDCFGSVHSCLSWLLKHLRVCKNYREVCLFVDRTPYPVNLALQSCPSACISFGGKRPACLQGGQANWARIAPFLHFRFVVTGWTFEFLFSTNHWNQHTLSKTFCSNIWSWPFQETENHDRQQGGLCYDL